MDVKEIDAQFPFDFDVSDIRPDHLTHSINAGFIVDAIIGNRDLGMLIKAIVQVVCPGSNSGLTPEKNEDEINRPIKPSVYCRVTDATPGQPENAKAGEIR